MTGELGRSPTHLARSAVASASGARRAQKGAESGLIVDKSVVVHLSTWVSADKDLSFKNLIIYLFIPISIYLLSLLVGQNDLYVWRFL